jgi:hypothetical protein
MIMSMGHRGKYTLIGSPTRSMCHAVEWLLAGSNCSSRIVESVKALCQSGYTGRGHTS